MWKRGRGGRGRIRSAFARLGPPNPGLDIYFFMIQMRHRYVNEEDAKVKDGQILLILETLM